ncbi:MAG: aminotransferase class I/II-fold pyridoxal phosphate-dependent enzyme [Sphaerochaetaceae bacterium]|nr:aminotransferase class I/II-fold pyridoxal phosphate-dependent enzyme [Sphaerochaetaceae bacterium]
MLNFESDYTTGAHPEILKRLMETNMESQTGYGFDDYCISAAEKIKKECADEKAQVEFLTGGTQTNQVVIATMTMNGDGIIAAQTGHINGHEAGAIETVGRKVFGLEHKNGKISASQVRAFTDNYYADANHEHMVRPAMVYISHPTEYGTLYTLDELEDLSAVCREKNLKLFLDGARLGYGLMSLQTDVTIKDIARLTDVFYIGGTKVGALCGEAVVFTHNNKPERFLARKKQLGALLAKGRLLGVQFDTLFTDGLYYRIAKNAIDRAEELKTLLKNKGYTFFMDSPTNQQFVAVDNKKYEELKKKVRVGFWETIDENHTAIRFATSWSTTKEDIEALEAIL